MSISGKNKRRQLTCFDEIHNQTLSVDSAEECDTLAWLTEACKLSVINDFSYQPPSFQLFDSVKYQDINNKPKTLFREHEYTPDWVLSFSPAKQLLLAKEFKVQYSELSNANCSVFIDVKGIFAKNDGGRSFSINQKWIYDKFKIYIYKLIPKNFFEIFGVPEKCILTQKTKKPRKIFENFKKMTDIFKVNNIN